MFPTILIYYEIEMIGIKTYKSEIVVQINTDTVYK